MATRSVCFYFQVHQPFRVRNYRMYDIGNAQAYFDTSDPRLSNKAIFRKVAEKSYLPTNAVILDLLAQHPEFSVSFSITGTLLEQAERWGEDVLDSFKALAQTGRVEFLAETYYHSLSFLYSAEEFAQQVSLHSARIKELFGVTPRVFRNTELIYTDALADAVAALGYVGCLMEGADHILDWRSPNHVYHSDTSAQLPLLLKNYRLSDDIAFRFSDRGWSSWPLKAETFAQWVDEAKFKGPLLNLFMDYETFGEHQWEDTGIFNFLRALPGEILATGDVDFVTPSEALERYKAVSSLSVPGFVSWADLERDLSAWRSNGLQESALEALYALEDAVKRTDDPLLLDDWRKLTTSDHFYYMCVKYFADGDVHKYFNPYETPYDAYISFMNALRDIELRVDRPAALPLTSSLAMSARG